MLELIFQGFFEWIYGLILEAWEFFSGNLVDLMSMDFAYLQTHIPVLPAIRQSMLAVGWALLIGNLVFQATRSMMAGLGFEAEDPKLLFMRTFVFSFLLLASPQICEICLNMTSTVINIMELPDAVNIDIIHESAFDGLACAWLLVFICGIVIMFQSFKLIAAMAERYFILAVLTITAPLAFGMGGSRNTSDIFTGWCRMYGSMCLLMVLNVVFVKMLLSVLSTVPTGLSVLPWMVLIIAIVKVAKKADGIVSRIGLNPAMTGDSLGRTFPGILTYMVTHTAVSHATKALGKTLGKDNGGKGASGTGPRGGGPRGGGGAGAQHGASPNMRSGSKSGGPAWGGTRKPVDVSAEDWEPTPQGAAAHTPAKEHRTESPGRSSEQHGQQNPIKPASEQTRRSSVPRGTANGAQKTAFVRPSASFTANNENRKFTTNPAQPAAGRITAKDGDPGSRPAGTSENTRLSNVSAEKRRPSPLSAAQREASRTSKSGGMASGSSSERTAQRTDATRFTQRTVSQRGTGSPAKPKMAGTDASAPARQAGVERHGGNTTPVSVALPATGKSPVSARQEKAPDQKEQPMEKTRRAAIRPGTAGTGAVVSTRHTAREERHSRNTSTQRKSAVSTVGAVPTVPAQQESKPVPTTISAESGRTPPINSGMAGTGISQTTRLSMRDGRQRRNAPDIPSAATTTAKASDTARQERTPRPSAELRNSGSSFPIRSGTAGTAPTGAGISQTRQTAPKPVSPQKQMHISNDGAGDKPVKPLGVKTGQKTTRKSALKKGRKKHG